MPDFIESGDNDFAKQFTTFTDFVKANTTTLSVSAAESTNLESLCTTYKKSLDSYTAADATAASLRQAKDSAREAAEQLMRALNKRFQANPAITAAQKAAMRIGVPAGTRTRAAVPETAPVATVESSGHLRHLLNFRDESTPGSKARPAGVAGAEVWCAITAQGAPPPAGPAAYHMLAQDLTPHLVEHDPADTGKTAYYLLRWVNTRAEKGPWSTPASATIG